MRRATNSSRLLLALLLPAAFACDASKPEFVDGETVSIVSSLEAGTATNTHEFGVTNSGTVEIRLTDLTLADPGSGEVPETLRLFVQLGRPAGDVCSTTLTEVLELEGFFTAFLESRVYCLLVSRPSSLAEDSVLDYALQVQSHF